MLLMVIKKYTKGGKGMANKTIKNKFKNLYNEYKDNLSDESRVFLEKMFTLDGKSIHDYRFKLFNALCDEAERITFTSEMEFPIEKLIEADYENFGVHYRQALIMLEEDIEKCVKTQGYTINRDVVYDSENYVLLNLIDRYKAGVNNIKEQFNITGEVIDFFLKVGD